MTKPPKNYLLWEGLPFIAATVSQCLYLMSSRYREAWLDVGLLDPDEHFECAVAVSLVLFALLLASLMLFILRRWWPAIDAPDRSFRITFLGAASVLLTLVAALIILIAPAWLALDQDGKSEEAQRNAP